MQLRLACVTSLFLLVATSRAGVQTDFKRERDDENGVLCLVASCAFVRC
jgi:hypothetical protein